MNIENIVGQMDKEQTKEMAKSCLVNLDVLEVAEVIKDTLDEVDLDELKAQLEDINEIPLSWDDC